MTVKRIGGKGEGRLGCHQTEKRWQTMESCCCSVEYAARSCIGAASECYRAGYRKLHASECYRADPGDDSRLGMTAEAERRYFTGASIAFISVFCVCVCVCVCERERASG